MLFRRMNCGWLGVCGLAICWALAMLAVGCDLELVMLVDPPTFEPDGGTFTGSADVTILCTTVGATIRYTTDETDPQETSTLYTGPIHLTATTTVNARAFKEGMICSDYTSAAFTITAPKPAPASPVVTSLVINKGAAETAVATVTLDNVCTDNPTGCIASESPSFDGAAWQAYSASLPFELSPGSGIKTVYFKASNALGESPVVSCAIAAMPRELTIDLGNQVMMELVLIPAGTFLMGSPDSAGRDMEERPQHGVTLTRAYYMGKYEVTQAQWRAIMGNNPSYYQAPDFPGSDYRPVELVDWVECKNYCQALAAIAGRTCRLPTEAEWEYACRAGSTTEYYYGDSAASLKAYAWYVDNSDDATHPVGGKLPNAFGLYDMYGNIMELCQDWHIHGYNLDLPTTDPTGPRAGRFPFVVVRGGEKHSTADECRSAWRSFRMTDEKQRYLGFRVVAELR